jgi:hypothetical protein
MRAEIGLDYFNVHHYFNVHLAQRVRVRVRRASCSDQISDQISD